MYNLPIKKKKKSQAIPESVVIQELKRAGKIESRVKNKNQFMIGINQTIYNCSHTW
jgi:hypothetical protein